MYWSECMIDPKLNEIPANTKTGPTDLSDTSSVKSNAAAGAKPRAGLSINDTVASDANLSVGSRGVDTSGVRAGTGAGDGGTFVTPGSAGESPAPNIVPGARGSGTTTLSNTAPGQRPTQTDAGVTQTTSGGVQHTSSGSILGLDSELSQEEIASHAYRCWHERGCPEGSPEEDWRRAEQELRNRGLPRKTSTASA